MPELEVTLAGRIALRCDQQERGDADFTGRQLRLVTAVLVLERRDVITVDFIAGELWPDRLPDQWRPALRGLVSRVRRALRDLGLPSTAISSVGGAYRVELDDVRVDLEQAMHWARAATEAADGNRLEDARDLANRARAVLSRPVVPGADGPWLDAVRERSHDRLIDVLVTLGIVRSRLGLHTQARTVLAEAVDEAPLREDAWRALMQAEVAAGNAAGALDAYGRCRSTLAEQLGVDPSEATQRVHSHVLATIPEPSASAASTAAVASRPGAAGTALPGDAVASSPYVGLRAFRQTEADRFFGRTGDVQELVTRLGRRGIVAVVGPSGVGKSSLVRAGLLHSLERGAIPDSDTWTALVVVPGATPIKTLAAELAAQSEDLDDMAVQGLLSDDVDGLHVVVERILADGPPSARLVLVIDQLEELFTLGDPVMAEQFVGQLTAATRRVDARVVVVVTLRADFVEAAARIPGMADMLSRVQYVVPPLVGEQVEEVVVAPARRVGAQLEPGLVATILTDVAGQPGSLPLLQHLLHELWERRVGPVMTRGAYADLGGVAGALANRADAVFEDLDAAGRADARRALLRAVQPGEDGGDTRRPVRESEWTGPGDDPARVEATVGRLVDARLMTASHDAASGERVVELAHEALIDGWPRLRGWVDEARGWLLDHRRLTAAAEDWRRHDSHDDWLLAGLRLDEAHELLLADGRGDVDLHLSPTEHDLVTVSLAARERDRAARADGLAREERQEARRVRRLRILATGATILAVVAATTGAMALRARSSADRAAAQAEATAAEARADALAFAASAAAGRDLGRAGLLAAEAWAAAPDLESASALLDVLAVDPRLAELVDDPDATSCGWPSDTTIVFTRADDASEKVADLRSWPGMEPILSFPIAADTFCAAIAPSGRWVTANRPGGLAVHDAMTGELLAERTGEFFAYTIGIAFHPDRPEALIVLADGTPQRVTLPDLEPTEGEALPPLAGVLDVPFWSERGDHVVVPTDEQAAHVVASDGTVTTIEVEGDGSTQGAFVSDGLGVAGVATSDGLWLAPLTDPAALVEVRLIGEPAVTWVGMPVSPDGRTAVVTTTAGVEVVDLAKATTTGEPLAIDAGAGMAVHFQPDGAFVVASPSITARIEPDRSLAFAEPVALLPPPESLLVPSPDGSGAFDVGRVTTFTDLGTGQSTQARMGNGERRVVVALLPDGRWMRLSLAAGTFERFHGNQVELLEQLDPALRPDLKWIWGTAQVDDQVAVAVTETLPGVEPHQSAVIVVDHRTGAVQTVIESDPDGPGFGYAIPAGKGRLLVAYDDGSFRFHDMEGEPSGASFRVGAGAEVMGATPDGRLLALATAGGPIIVINREGDQVASLEGSTAAALMVGFARGGEWLVSRHLDGATLVWDIGAQRLIGELFRSSDYSPWGAVVSTDGESVLQATPEGVVRIPLDPETWLDAVCARTAGSLGEAELDAVAPGHEARSPCA